MGVKREGGGYGVAKFCQIYSTLYPIRRITRKHYQIQRAVYVMLYRFLPATIPLLVGSSEETEVKYGPRWDIKQTASMRSFQTLIISFPFLLLVSSPHSSLRQPNVDNSPVMNEMMDERITDLNNFSAIALNLTRPEQNQESEAEQNQDRESEASGLRRSPPASRTWR